MRVLVQRVQRASAALDSSTVAAIEKGLVVFVGFGRRDDHQVVRRMARKLANIRVFDHGSSYFERSLVEENAEVLTISQFTVYADTSRGRRPNFSRAAPTQAAQALYELFAAELTTAGARRVAVAPFRSRLVVDVVNWGPCTLMLDSDEI